MINSTVEKHWNIFEFIVLLSKNRTLILSTAFTFFLSAFVYLMLLPDTYIASVKVVPSKVVSEHNSNFSSIMSATDIMGISLPASGSSALYSQYIAKLQTNSFLGNYIKNNNLKKFLFPNDWSFESNKWINNEPSDVLASKVLLDMLSFKKNRMDEAKVLTIGIEWENPNDMDIVAETLNGIVANINRIAKSNNILQSNKNIDFLKKELNNTSILNIKNLIHGLIEKEMSTKTLANTKDDYIFTIIDKAITPIKPKNKNFVFILFISLLSGLVFGLFLSLILESYNRDKYKYNQ